MESITCHPILKFHPDTVTVIRRKYNFNKTEDMEKAIDILNEWIKQQEHFTKRNFSREYLERTIVSLKGSIERAKLKIDRLCTMRTLLPRFFEKTQLGEEHIDKYFVQVLLPNLTEDHYRLYMQVVLRKDFNSKIIFNELQFVIVICEYFKLADYCDGIIIFFDFRELDFVHGAQELNINDMTQFLKILTEGYALRIKSIHILTNSKALEILSALTKQFLSKKINDRIHIHNTLESVHKYIPKNLLPADYGGNEKKLLDLFADWCDLMSTENTVNLLKEMNNARTNESLRPKDKFNEEYMGMVGTFRSFEVD